MKKLILLLAFVGVLISCEDDEQVEFVDLRVHHYKNTAVGLDPQLVLLVQEGNDIDTDTWYNFYSHIEGFTHELGYQYVLSVKKETIPNPPQDASGARYSLVKILSKEKVDDTVEFDIYLKGNGLSFVNTSSSGFKILDTTTIDCGALCNDLEDKLQGELDIKGTFKHIDQNTIQLIRLN